MKLLLVGYGRMGRLVEELAKAEGLDVVGCIDIHNAESDWPQADVAINFSVAEAVPEMVKRLGSQGTNIVIGTTGWRAQESELRRLVKESNLGVVAAENFSIGINIFQLLAAEAGRLMAGHDQYGAFLHERHHSQKRDAPSGTALTLRDVLAQSGYQHSIDMSSVRAGQIPGTHTIGFDGSSDTIELTHTARDRRGFASGALLAAHWITGRHGWYSMTDVLQGERARARQS